VLLLLPRACHFLSPAYCLPTNPLLLVLLLLLAAPFTASWHAYVMQPSE
jgi:hypothetical protein